MDKATKDAAIAAFYQEAHDQMVSAALVLKEAVAAAECGNMNLARGTAIEAEMATMEATQLMSCAAMLHGLRGF